MILSDIRQKVVDTAKAMLKYGLTTGTWGNVSIRHNHNLVAITPSGVGYEDMCPEEIVIVDLEGNIIDGKLKPSSELPMHLAIYCEKPEIGAVVHTHSSYASAFAVLHLEIPVILAEMASVIGGSVPVVPYCRPGSFEVGSTILPYLKDRSGVLLGNHGVVAVGKTADEALVVAQVIEDGAKIYQMAYQMGEPERIPEEEIKVLREQYIKYYGQK